MTTNNIEGIKKGYRNAADTPNTRYNTDCDSDHIDIENFTQQEDEPFFGPESHTMNVSVAIQCKSSEAGLIFNHILFWIKNNKIREVNQIKGRTWMYETILHMQKFLPYLSDMQIKRALASLVENGYLLKENYNNSKFDKTSWYALAREEWIDFKIISPKGQVRPIGKSSTTHGQGEYDPSYKDKDRKEKIEKEDREEKKGTHSPDSFKKKPKEPEPAKIPYGSHVLLKPNEYEALSGELGKDLVDYYIQAINLYVPNNGPYKDYAATIRSWHLRDKAKGGLPSNLNLKKASTPTPDAIVQNRRLCEAAEAILKPKFNGYVYFTAHQNHAVYYNKNKDVKIEYVYEKFDKQTLKETLLKDLDMAFPGARELLLGQPKNKSVTEMVSQLAQKFKIEQAQ